MHSLSRVSEGYVHPKTNACSPVNSQLGAGHDRRPGPVDPVDNDRRRCSAGADRWHSLLPSYAPGLVELHGQPGWVAALTPLSVDGILLMAETLIMGPGPQSHIPMPDIGKTVVLYRHRDGAARDDIRRVPHPGGAKQAHESKESYDDASTHESSVTVAAAGKRTSARVPPSSRLESETVPRQRRASVCTIASPSPVPELLPPALPRAKRSKSRLSSPGASPGPSSSTASQA